MLSRESPAGTYKRIVLDSLGIGGTSPSESFLEYFTEDFGRELSSCHGGWSVSVDVSLVLCGPGRHLV